MIFIPSITKELLLQESESVIACDACQTLVMTGEGGWFQSDYIINMTQPLNDGSPPKYLLCNKNMGPTAEENVA